MPDTYVLIYTLIDEVFKINGHKEPPRTKVSDSEVAFLFIAACLDFGANVEKAQDRLHGFGAIRAKLDKSQLNRRIHALRDPILAVNALLMELKKKRPQDKALPPTQRLSQCARILESLGASC